MANCTKCGAELSSESAFCGSCGNRVAGGQSGATASPLTPASAGGSGAVASGTGLTMNLAAALSYVLGAITGVLFLVIEPYKNNRFVRFHAMQSIIFCVACVVLAIVWSIVIGILVSIAGLWVLTIDLPIHWLVGLGIFAFWLFLMFQAYSNREYRIPWIGDIAAKQVK